MSCKQNDVYYEYIEENKMSLDHWLTTIPEKDPHRMTGNFRCDGCGNEDFFRVAEESYGALCNYCDQWFCDKCWVEHLKMEERV